MLMNFKLLRVASLVVFFKHVFLIAFKFFIDYMPASVLSSLAEFHLLVVFVYKISLDQSAF